MIFTSLTVTVLTVSIPIDDYIGEEEEAVEVCLSLSSDSEIQFNNILTALTNDGSGNYPGDFLW